MLPLTTWVYEPSSSTKKKRHNGSASSARSRSTPNTGTRRRGATHSLTYVTDISRSLTRWTATANVRNGEAACDGSKVASGVNTTRSSSGEASTAVSRRP